MQYVKNFAFMDHNLFFFSRILLETNNKSHRLSFSPYEKLITIFIRKVHSCTFNHSFKEKNYIFICFHFMYWFQWNCEEAHYFMNHYQESQKSYRVFRHQNLLHHGIYSKKNMTIFLHDTQFSILSTINKSKGDLYRFVVLKLKSITI